MHIATNYVKVKQSLLQHLYFSCQFYPPSLNLSSLSFDQTTKATRQLFSRKSATLPSSTLDWLQPLSLIFLQAVTIHCLWHSPVGSLTPFNQINFIFLSMPCNWMSQMGRDVTWFRMSIFWQQFVFTRLRKLARWVYLKTYKTNKLACIVAELKQFIIYGFWKIKRQVFNSWWTIQVIF